MTGPIQFEQPLPATWDTSNTPCLVHGIVGDSALCQLDDGKIKWIAIAEISIDFRYDYKRGLWVNVSMNGEDDGFDEEDDWGARIPGTLPDVDRDRDGDQSDEADHDPRDVDTSEAAP